MFVYTDMILLTENFNVHRYYLVNKLILTMSMTIIQFHSKDLFLAPCTASNPIALACNIYLQEKNARHILKIKEKKLH